MRDQVAAFSQYLVLYPFPSEVILADYALHDLEVLTLPIIICGSIDVWLHLQELVLLVAIDAGAEAAVVRETFNEQLQEGLEVRV
jgi:hypothetical protein